MTGRGKRLFFSPQHPDGLTQPPLQWVHTRELFPVRRVGSGRSVRLTTHPHPMPSLRIVEQYFHTHTHLHGVGIFTGYLTMVSVSRPHTPSYGRMRDELDNQGIIPASAPRD
jgi:hypothetical protein